MPEVGLRERVLRLGQIDGGNHTTPGTVTTGDPLARGLEGMEIVMLALRVVSDAGRRLVSRRYGRCSKDVSALVRSNQGSREACLDDHPARLRLEPVASELGRHLSPAHRVVALTAGSSGPGPPGSSRQ
jgi:hypothetical protein